MLQHMGVVFALDASDRVARLAFLKPNSSKLAFLSVFALQIFI